LIAQEDNQDSVRREERQNPIREPKPNKPAKPEPRHPKGADTDESERKELIVRKAKIIAVTIKEWFAGR
jgi:hypothetical protein